jgi:DNA-binding transcriptional MerR regulator
MGPIKRHFDIREASTLTGLSEKMIDYLCRTEVVRPSGTRQRKRGKKRLFLFADVLMLQLIEELLARGVSVARLKTAMKKIRTIQNKAEPMEPLTRRFLITDGETVFYRDQAGIIELIEHPDQFVFSFIIDAENKRSELVQKIRTAEQSLGSR